MTTYYVKYRWTKENHGAWHIQGLQEWDHLVDQPVPGPQPIHPGMNETCDTLRSLMNGIHRELYDLYQVDSRIADDDEFIVQPLNTRGWDGKIRVKLNRELRFITADSFHIVPDKSTAQFMNS